MPGTSTPRTRLPDARVTPRFAGVCSFCRFPLVSEVPAECRPLDWLVYGVPFDTGVTYRPGARFGPRAIREASQYVKAYSMEHDVNICEVLSIADAGDAPVLPFELKETLDGVTAHALGLARTHGEASRPARLMAVGGDHSVAYANMKATWQAQGSPAGGMALVHLDSHLDTVDAVWGEKWSHASVFIRAIEEGIVDPRRMISIGVKGPLNSAKDLDFARDKGVTLVTADRWRREGGAPIAAFLDRFGGAGAYVTFDIDCVDPAFAPGTGTPSVGGFTSAEALGILRALSRGGRGFDVLGADVVEVLPDRDPAGITSFLAAHVLFEILALDARRRAPR
jgi:agmatinase